MRSTSKAPDNEGPRPGRGWQLQELWKRLAMRTSLEAGGDKEGPVECAGARESVWRKVAARVVAKDAR